FGTSRCRWWEPSTASEADILRIPHQCPLSGVKQTKFDSPTPHSSTISYEFGKGGIEPPQPLKFADQQLSNFQKIAVNILKLKPN
ncbi:MAG: hypothetical protein ACE5GT_07460, partial [Rhodospirillales bacterium]